MSLQSVREILKRVQEDEDFRNRLKKEPDLTLKGFDLTELEISKFKKIGDGNLAKFKSNLDRRYSKDGSSAGGAGGNDDDWWVDSVTD